MQDRYTGDIGDFVKYGLLREITGRKRLGVAWYLHPDAGRAGDGSHTKYLEQRQRWHHLDPQLFETLEKLVSDDNRSVQAVQRSGVLGDAAFAGEPLDVSGVRWRDRRHWRQRWFEAVQNRLSGCEVVFADPDNGLVQDDRFRPERKQDAKRIPLAEATALAEGRTAVIYHHNGRRPGRTLVGNPMLDGPIAGLLLCLLLATVEQPDVLLHQLGRGGRTPARTVR